MSFFVIFSAFCLDITQCCMNGAPNNSNSLVKVWYSSLLTMVPPKASVSSFFIYTFSPSMTIYLYHCIICKSKTFTSEFESYWEPHSYGLVPYPSKKRLVKHTTPSTVGHLGWCNSRQARQANLHEWNRVSLGALLIRPCATSKQKT